MIIVSHKLYLKTGSTESVITIDIHKPEQNDRDWTCRYDVNWPEGMRKFYGHGVDALQALVGALYMIGAEIYSSSYHREGRLRAYDKEEGYGFPVVSSIRDLLVGSDKIAF
jgi:hypothetical protein